MSRYAHCSCAPDFSGGAGMGRKNKSIDIILRDVPADVVDKTIRNQGDVLQRRVVI